LRLISECYKSLLVKPHILREGVRKCFSTIEKEFKMYRVQKLIGKI
jgi:hypothetical protein